MKTLAGFNLCISAFCTFFLVRNGEGHLSHPQKSPSCGSSYSRLTKSGEEMYCIKISVIVFSKLCFTSLLERPAKRHFPSNFLSISPFCSQPNASQLWWHISGGWLHAHWEQTDTTCNGCFIAMKWTILVCSLLGNLLANKFLVSEQAEFW